MYRRAGGLDATRLQIDTIDWGCAAQRNCQTACSLRAYANRAQRLFISDSVMSLSQNHPNPFSGVTTISFRTIENGETRLWVADVLGRQEAVLTNGTRSAGSYMVTFDGNALHTGIYYYILETPTHIVRKTMVIEK